MCDSGNMTLCTQSDVPPLKHKIDSLNHLKPQFQILTHDPKLLGPGRTLFICLLLCVALPVFYILAHLCVCSVNESTLYLFSVREGDALLSAQNSLIGKLKEACQMLGAKLEELAQSSRYKALSDHVYPISFFHSLQTQTQLNKNWTQSSSCQVQDLHLHLWSRFRWLWKTWKCQFSEVSNC